MGHRMISDFVTLSNDATHDSGIGPGICRNNVESSFDVPFLKNIEETRCVGRMRTVIEGQCNEGEAGLNFVVGILYSD